MNTIPPAALKQAAKELPPSPQIFGKLGSLLKDPDTGLDDITELVNTDSSLTASVLRLSNSALYSLGTPVDTLDEAINRVGFRELFKLVGMAAASQIFSDQNRTYNVSGDLLWENSLACGLAMEKLAQIIGKDEQEAYTVGLLRSMGKMVIDTCVADDDHYPCYGDDSRMPIVEWEESNFGITNPVVSGFVLKSWNFSDDTCYTIQYQYFPEKAPNKNPMIYMLNLANRMASGIGKGIYSETPYWKLNEERLNDACINSDDYDNIVEQVKENLEKIVSSIYRTQS
ncbi:MAG: HDOD domain-containing protein [Verrucomicrobiota bacterium]